ncbi:MAG: SUMF1/EgtB/PvdO family nonheme iron enzyme [Planctomycetaceae bacterium]
MTHNAGITLAGLCCLLALSGCGAQPKSAPPGGGGEIANAPPPTPVAAQPGAGGSTATAAAGENRAVAAKGSSGPRAKALPDAPPSYRFDVGADIPNLEVVSADDPRSGALVALVEPPIGVDSSMVALEDDLVQGRTSFGAAPTGGAPTGFTVVEDAGRSEDGLPLRLRCEKDGSEMVLVPAGLFLQGREGADPDAAPMHPVEVSAFYIDVFEVTLAQYEKYWKETRPLPGRAANHGGADTLPAVGVNWRDASAYLKWVGKELPTEAEWEKAARGPNQFLYPWGDGRVLWHRRRTPQQIDPVGSYPADRSIYGAMDLAGNAREWCADFYTDDAYKEAAGTAGGVPTDWKGPKQGSPPAHHVVRGSAADWQLWHRGNAAMLAPTDDIGFRGVLHLKGATAASNAPPPSADSNEPPASATPAGAGRRRRGAK